MFDKLLSSIGIGSAKVDTRLGKKSYIVGETIEGEVYIKGGNTEQTIDNIYLTLMTDYEVEVDDHKVRRTCELDKILLTEPFTIGANEEKVVLFKMKIPHEAPVTLGKTRIWIQTGLDIKNAIDPKDTDFLEIKPHPLVMGFLDAVSRLGFRLYQVDSEKAPSYFRNGLPFVQEFEFKAISGEFARKLDELEAVFQLTEDEANVLLQIDRRARGFSSFLAESLNMDESYVRLSYNKSDISKLDQILGDIIRKHC